MEAIDLTPLGNKDPPHVDVFLLVLQELARRGYVSILEKDGTEVRVRDVGGPTKEPSSPGALDFVVDLEGVQAAIERREMPTWLVREWPRWKRASRQALKPPPPSE